MVVGRSLPDGGVYTVADIGRESSLQADPAADSQGETGSSTSSRSTQEQQQDEALRGMHFATVKLRPGIDTVILGSQGLWCVLAPMPKLRQHLLWPACCEPPFALSLVSGRAIWASVTTVYVSCSCFRSDNGMLGGMLADIMVF